MTILHHLALGARDPDRLASFYRDVLGLPELQRHHDAEQLRSVWLALGTGALMIERIPVDSEHTTHQGTAPGLFLLAVAIPEAERTAWTARLEAAGCSVDSSTSAFTSYTRDPEGNRVAVSFYPI